MAAHHDSRTETGRTGTGRMLSLRGSVLFVAEYALGNDPPGRDVLSGTAVRAQIGFDSRNEHADQKEADSYYL